MQQKHFGIEILYNKDNSYTTKGAIFTHFVPFNDVSTIHFLRDQILVEIIYEITYNTFQKGNDIENFLNRDINA